MARSELNTLLPLYCSLSSRHRLIFLKGCARGTREGERRCPLLFLPSRARPRIFSFRPQTCYAGYCIAPLKGIQGSLGFWIPAMDSGLFVSGTWIPDSFSCISDSTPKICCIPESTRKNFPDSGIRIPLPGAICNYF